MIYKFRAWDKPYGKMIYNNGRLADNRMAVTFDGKIISFDDKAIKDHEHETEICYYPERFELMQFTGRTDRHGKDIYAGDLVTHKDFIPGTVTEVVFDENMGAWLIKNGWDDDNPIPGQTNIGNSFPPLGSPGVYFLQNFPGTGHLPLSYPIQTNNSARG